MYFDELPKEGFEKCIICGKKTKGTAFCKDCWKEHDNDELLSILNEKTNAIENICPICGEPTSIYMGKARKDGLCKVHAKKLKNGELFFNGEKYIENPIVKNIKNTTNEIKNKEEIRTIKNPFSKNTSNIEKNIKKEDKIESNEDYNDFTEQKENKCLLCDNDSGKYLFCKKCYSQYHGKTLLLKITCDQNQKLELLNESYEGVYTCKDGHIVKSKSEREIDNYLFEHKIAHAYEKALIINGETFKPDFYLKDMDIYIEHWGYNSDNEEYTRRKEYKLPKYKEKGITLIQTNEKDMQDPETALELKLSTYKKGEINEE